MKYYGSQLRFYVNPENPTLSEDGSGLNTSGSDYSVYGAYADYVMDNMVKLLNEDAFAEELLLRWQDTSNAEIVDDATTPYNEEDVYKYLPVKDFWEEGTALATSLNEAIDKAIEPVMEKIKAESEAAAAQEYYIEAVADYLEAANVLKEKWNDVFGTSHGEYSELLYNNLTATDKAKEGFSEVEKAFGAEREKSKEMSNATIKLTSAKDDIQLKDDAMKPYRGAVLSLWEKTSHYKKMLSKFSSAVRCSFLTANENREDANKFARSFIYVSISVYGDANREFGEEVYEIVKDFVPAYVAENMAIPKGYQSTNCSRVSRNDEIKQTNVGYTRREAIKSAFLMAVAFGVVACAVIIIVDRSDKRLRDCDVITREFQVPILGFVPTIDMDNTGAKKNTASKQDKEEK